MDETPANGRARSLPIRTGYRRRDRRSRRPVIRRWSRRLASRLGLLFQQGKTAFYHSENQLILIGKMAVGRGMRHPRAARLFHPFSRETPLGPGYVRSQRPGAINFCQLSKRPGGRSV